MRCRKKQHLSSTSHIDTSIAYCQLIIMWGEVNLLFNVTINDISVIYVTAHRCADGLEKKLDLRSVSQRHRHDNPVFNEYFLVPMYPAELEIKDTKESITSTSYLGLLLSIGKDGRLCTSIYDKSNFYITTLPFPSSIITSSPAYGVLCHKHIK